MAIVILVALGALAALGHLVAALYLANRFTRSPRRRVRGTPADAGLRYEEVQFHAADRVALRGWFIESPGARAVVAVVHDGDGTRADPERGLLAFSACAKIARFSALSRAATARWPISGNSHSVQILSNISNSISSAPT